jgi:hypothetical protein
MAQTGVIFRVEKRGWTDFFPRLPGLLAARFDRLIKSSF